MPSAGSDGFSGLRSSRLGGAGDLAGQTPAEAERFSLPETHPPEPLSTPAVVTKGRTPAEDYLLPPPFSRIKWDDFHENMRHWAAHPAIEILTQTEDAGFYALPLYADGSGGKALIRWRESLAEFDWMFCSGPQISPPQMDRFDVDGDGEDELIVICYTGSGTGVSVEELHILEKGPDGTPTDCAFPESLWQEEVPKLFDTAELNGRTFAMLGHGLVEFSHKGLDLEKPSSGMIAGFSTEDWGGLRFRGAFCLSPPDSAAPCYVAETSSEILYRDGVFTLQDFHLYSYDQ